MPEWMPTASSDIFHSLIPEEFRNTGEKMTAAEFAQKQCDWYNESEGRLEGLDCPECKNRGNYQFLDADGNRVMRECKCMAQRRYITTMKNSGLAELYEKCTFDTYKVSNEWQRTCKELAMRYVEQDGNGWFFFGGQSGSGKTHLCTAICSELAKRGRQIMYIQWKRFFAELVQTKFKQFEQEQLFSVATQSDVLYLDDFLKTPHNVTPNEEMLSYALEIVDARYKADKKTIFSSEFMTEEISGFDEALGGRIYEKSKSNKVLLKRGQGRNYRYQKEE